MVADFVDFLIRSHALEEKYREDSIYGLTLVFEKLIVCTVLFMLSLLLEEFWEGVVFTVCFLMLRQATGGFHAKSFRGCFIGSIATVVLTLEVFVPLLAKYKIIPSYQYRNPRGVSMRCYADFSGISRELWNAIVRNRNNYQMRQHWKIDVRNKTGYFEW